MAIPLLLMVLTGHVFCATALRSRCVKSPICLVQSSTHACAQKANRILFAAVEYKPQCMPCVDYIDCMLPVPCCLQLSAQCVPRNGMSVLRPANVCSMHSARRLAQAGTNTVVTTGDAMAHTGNNNFVGAAQQAVNDPQNAQTANLAAKQVSLLSRGPAACAVPHFEKPGHSEAEPKCQGRLDVALT
jgi:hypothetical protein